MGTAAVAARENRAFLGRAVRFLADEAGIRQFLDIGAGLPSAHAVHEIVQGCVPMARVVYADHDPVVIRHADALIGGTLNVSAIRADLREPRALLTHATMSHLIDLAEPVAILLVAVLHFLEDGDDPWAIVNFLKDQIAPGSYVVISHGSDDHIPDDVDLCPDEPEDGKPPNPDDGCPALPVGLRDLVEFEEAHDFSTVLQWLDHHVR